MSRFLMVAALFAAVMALAGAADGAEMVLAKGGEAKAPIIVPADAPYETVRAANYLAEYIEKVSGARPETIEGSPETPPESAVWVGVHPGMDALLPEADLAFEQPEEIRIACNGRHLMIAGRDRFLAGEQVEFGTANAVYAFIEEYLDVRWLWPGPLGEDIVEKDTLAFEAFAYRFAPPFRQRDVFWREGGELLAWSRFQRSYLDSLSVPAGHAFTRWWEQYHEEHPDYFALQPDGTRSGYPSPGNVKLCQSNPRVWAQWLSNVEQALEENPATFVFNAAPNDGSSAGICVCDNCRAWDNLEGRRYRLSWRGLTQEYVAMTDRYIKFTNTLARMLKERYPERELFVSQMAYGPAKPPPSRETLDDNVVVGYVGHFPISNHATREREKAEWKEWAAAAPALVHRPNLFWYSGGWHGIPTVAVRNTIEDFRFLAENSGRGLAIDHPPQHFSPLAPQHYAMVKMAWDPMQDGEALMRDFYRRGFGKAAEKVEGYYALMEEAHMGILNKPGWRHSMGAIRQVAQWIPEFYSPEALAKAEALLDEAEALLAGEPQKYRDRLDFVRLSLEYTRDHIQIIEAMNRVRDTGGRDRAAVERAIELCERREDIFERGEGIAYHAHHFNITWNRARRMQDYIGPPAERFLVAAGLAEGEQDPEDAPGDKGSALSAEERARRVEEFHLVAAEDAGWRRVFADDFDREGLGEDWRIVDGTWTVSDGALITGGGTLVTTRSFPGLQRIEYWAATNVKPFPFFGPDTQASVSYSDISTILQSEASEGGSPLQSGYFLQFGGMNNTRNRLLREGAALDESSDKLIEPDKLHHIVAECDGESVRLVVDGKLVLVCDEPLPLVGPGNDGFGFYMWTGARVERVEVYTREP